MSGTPIEDRSQSDSPTDDNDHFFGEYRALIAVIGHISVQWSLFDAQLDNWSLVVFGDPVGGAALADEIQGEKALPREYGRKARWFRDCFTQLAPLKPFQADALNILDRSANLVDLRHDLIHGVLVDMHPDEGRFKFRITKIKGVEQHIQEFEFNAFRFPKIERDYSKLVGDSGKMSQRLLEHFAQRPR